jgi:putative oxidoreductase
MRPTELEDFGKLLLRVLVAGLMMFHGIDKIVHGPGHVMQDLAEHGAPVVLGYGVYLGEVVAPILVLLGAWTRLAALVYAGSITFATLQVHGADFLALKPTGAWAAELWVFYIVTPVVVALLGPGRYAFRRAPFPWD